MARILWLNFSSFADASHNMSGKTVEIGTTRGKIYDRNRQLLVDTGKKLVAAVTPVATAVDYISSIFDGEAYSENIEKGYPFVAEVSLEIDNELIKSFSVPVRYSESDVASHIVGYTDANGRGVTGIEKAFDKELSSYRGRLSVSFEVDALGRVLAGMDKTVRDEGFNSQGGVMLTIDKRIQQLTEEALEQSNIESGCAVVMHVSSGDIVASASIPDYDRNNLEKSLSEENSPLLNKVLLSYSAGSVFKSLLAAYALENGISEELCLECNGSMEISGKSFICYGETAHGRPDMAEALQKSCNIYFIKLMERIDCEDFLAFCRQLGIGEAISLCDGIECEEGSMPDVASLTLPGNRANFAFGQGELLVTPLQLVKAYHVLAMGTAVEPRLIYGFCDSNGKITREAASKEKRLLSDATVEKMRQLLYGVTENGIATNAKSELMKLAGKTGTAESGVYNENGEELYRTWFVGFYPANNPHYVVAVLNEDGTGGNSDCAGVFKNICEWIACNSLRNTD